MLSLLAKPKRSSSAKIVANRIASAAIASLHTELVLAPKPGLVCPDDSGSHHDMSATILYRSLFSLRHYFRAIAAAGYRGAAFAELQQLGIAAEARMLAATQGVNTHRGSIFNLGLLAAAAAYLQDHGTEITTSSLSGTVRERWGAAIQKALPSTESHGSLAAARYGAGGARAEAMRGFPSVFEIGLPALRHALGRVEEQRARIETLFVLMAYVEDTNVLYRGGPDGLKFVQEAAADFLTRGGTTTPDWLTYAQYIRNAFVSRRLSPGGSADLLAATLFVHTLVV